MMSKNDFPVQVHMPAWVRSEALAQRPAVQTGRRRIQGGAPNPNRARQGQEPVAQCGLSLWSPPTGIFLFLWLQNNNMSVFNAINLYI